MDGNDAASADSRSTLTSRFRMLVPWMGRSIKQPAQRLNTQNLVTQRHIVAAQLRFVLKKFPLPKSMRWRDSYAHSTRADFPKAGVNPNHIHPQSKEAVNARNHC